jgi:hypothetical protein
MTRVLDGETKKQKGACNYELFEMKLDFSSKLESFVKDVSKFGVLCMKHHTGYLKTGQYLFRISRY